MKDEAEANADADKKAREKVDKLNAADALVFQTEKQLKEYGDKLPAEQKAAIESSVNALKEAHKSQDIDAIDKAMEELNNQWQQASAEMYKNTEASGQQAGEAPGGNGGQEQKGPQDDGEVTDVDFEEVKDDK